MRALLGLSDDQLRLVLNPRRFIRWIYAGRLIIATAIFVAAILSWGLEWVQQNTLIATLAFFASLIFTGWSVWHTTVKSRPLTNTFLYIQLAFDVVLVTSVVHVTGQRDLSPFAPLYIVVNTTAALLLPIGGSLLLAIFGSVLYAADVFWWSEVGFEDQWLQVGVIILVATATSLLSARLQQMGASSPRLAAALTQARLEAADILGNIRSGILTVDVNGALLYANAAASDLLGIDLQRLGGRPVLADVGTVSPGMTAVIERAIREHHNTQREEATVTLDGREVPIGVTTTSNERDGTAVGRSITAIFQDISDQQRLDQLRRRTERLEAVAELGASLAHEIRNPLASIRSAVEQLGRSTRATPDEQTLTRLIVRESDRLSRLLGEFLDFARTRVTRLGTVDLSAIARGATTLAAEHPSKADGVQVECMVPDAPVVIEGDEDLLHRAVFNLVLNAVQATPSGGHVRVQVNDPAPTPLPVGIRFEQGAVSVHVTDDGPGIDADIRDRIFQPFATTKPGGSGLGLAVAHRAIEAHRGLVLVDTDASGTRFSVVLPRVQTPTPTTTGAAA
ncbi:MAG TPA: ATP-binding protein [Gemmatimonadaceae bacterium]|nr:ATP-binding protein [Gemmatimonadaceae bacterium]